MWFTALIQTHFNWNQSHLNKFAISSFKWICFHKEKAYKMYTINGRTNSIQLTHTHTHKHRFLPSVSPVYRETGVIIEFYGCDYYRQDLEAAILVHLFPSSPLFSLHRPPLFSSIDLVWTTLRAWDWVWSYINWMTGHSQLLILAMVSKATPAA